jgi:hypothetical protein
MTYQFIHTFVLVNRYLVGACVFALICNIDFHVSLLLYYLIILYNVNNENYKTECLQYAFHGRSKITKWQ